MYCLPSTALTVGDLKMVKNEFSVFREAVGKVIVGEKFFGRVSVQSGIAGTNQELINPSGTNKMFSSLQNKQFQLEAISWN